MHIPGPGKLFKKIQNTQKSDGSQLLITSKQYCMRR